MNKHKIQNIFKWRLGPTDILFQGGYFEGIRSHLGGLTQRVKSWYWGRPLVSCIWQETKKKHRYSFNYTHTPTHIQYIKKQECSQYSPSHQINTRNKHIINRNSLSPTNYTQYIYTQLLTIESTKSRQQWTKCWQPWKMSCSSYHLSNTPYSSPTSFGNYPESQKLSSSIENLQSSHLSRVLSFVHGFFLPKKFVRNQFNFDFISVPMKKKSYSSTNYTEWVVCLNRFHSQFPRR